MGFSCSLPCLIDDKAVLDKELGVKLDSIRNHSSQSSRSRPRTSSKELLERPADARRLVDEYVINELLGQGAFGVVHSCKRITTGEEFAVKMIDRVEAPIDEIEREVQILKNIKHQNIVSCHDVFFEAYFVCIVMDRLAGGDLVDLLRVHTHKKGKLGSSDIVPVVQQMSAGVLFLHGMCIVHRDIKLDNFLSDTCDLCNSGCRIVLGDFGTACPVKSTDRLNSTVGTKLYWAPEFFRLNYGLKVDTWALGVSVYNLLECKFPFRTEFEVKNARPKMPKEIEPSCVQYVEGLLEKNEEKRADAQAAAHHFWLQKTASCGHKLTRKLSGATQPDSLVAEVAPEVIDDAIIERRSELVERLRAAGEKRRLGPEARSGASQGGVFSNRMRTESHSSNLHSAKELIQRFEKPRHWQTKGFTTLDWETGRSSVRFEWWEEERVTKSGILETEQGGVTSVAGASLLEDGTSLMTVAVIGQMLRSHNIDTAQFGRGEAKTLEHLAAEVQSGTARLMLDATGHKKLVRVVDVVLIRLYEQTMEQEKILIETGEQYPDGRRREIPRLPGTKKNPHETLRESAARLLRELTGFVEGTVDFYFDEKEVYEEETESPTYPGVRTVYRKEIIEGIVSTNDSKLISRIGLPLGNDWSTVDSNGNVKFFAWYTPPQALALKVKLTGEDSPDASALVQAPLGLCEEDLCEYLEKNHVDVTTFGSNHAKTLDELASELRKGKSSLMRDPSGQLIRVVDAIVLIIRHPLTGHLLVEAERAFPDGTTTKLDRLPGAKKAAR